MSDQERLDRMEDKLDKLTSMMEGLIEYVVKRDNQAFNQDLTANMLVNFLYHG